MYTPELVAEKAYGAYCSNQGGVDINGQRFVPWQNLPETKKAAWMHVVHQITTDLNVVDKIGHDRSGINDAAAGTESVDTRSGKHTDDDHTTGDETKNDRAKAHATR
jgi:hypothetical protein